MSLKNKSSLYDRHARGTLGPTVERSDGEGPNPSNGNFFTEGGLSDSPFDTVRGPKMDQMVKMLTDNVTSGNTQELYGPAPGGDSNSPFQDLDGVDGGNGYFHGVANPGFGQGKKLGGVDLHEALLTQTYNNNGVVIGPSPGSSGFSSFQDMNGSISDSGIGFTNPETGNYDGPYVNNLGPSDGHY